MLRIYHTEVLFIQETGKRLNDATWWCNPEQHSSGPEMQLPAKSNCWSGGDDKVSRQAESCKDFLTWRVSPLPMTGPTMPGMVAKVLVIDSRMPAYLQTQSCRFSKASQLQITKETI